MGKEINIRNLYPEEIEIRSSMVKENGAMFLLYKDARCDMNILDETFGPMNWKNEHRTVDGKQFCTIWLWDDFKKEWIPKTNVGCMANNGADAQAKIKGEISDAFKRAATVVGIGRELYSAPMIWIGSDKIKITTNNGKSYVKDDLHVSDIAYEGRQIMRLVIKNRQENVVFQWVKPGAQKAATAATRKTTQQAKPKAAEPVTENPVAETPVTEKPAPAAQETAAAPKAEEGAISVKPAGKKPATPGEVTIPIGFAKGKTIAEFYQTMAKKAMDQGDAVDPDKIFAWFMDLNKPEFAGFKKAVEAFKKSVKAA